MQKNEFESYYANNSDMTVGQLHAHGLHAYPCECGEDGCKGWQMQHDSVLKTLKELRKVPQDA